MPRHIRTPQDEYIKWLRQVKDLLPMGAETYNYQFDWYAAWAIGTHPSDAVAQADEATTGIEQDDTDVGEADYNLLDSAGEKPRMHNERTERQIRRWWQFTDPL